jgi:hypothetical protein
MTSFDDRKKGQEEKFRHDQELVFKVHARRNRLFGVWAAGKMGISGAEMDAYAKDVVAADFQRPGDGDVIEKVQNDLAAKGVRLSDEQLKDELRRLEAEAKKQILSGS